MISELYRGIMHAVKKLKNKLIEFLRQGSSPGEMALAIALGVVIGMLPIQGITTLICALLAIIFRLNIIVIQMANYLSMPLMLLFIVPFFTIGHHLFDSSGVYFDPGAIMSLYHQDPVMAIRQFFSYLIHALLAWLIFAPPATLLIYLILLKPLKKMQSQNKGNKGVIKNLQ